MKTFLNWIINLFRHASEIHEDQPVDTVEKEEKLAAHRNAVETLYSNLTENFVTLAGIYFEDEISGDTWTCDNGLELEGPDMLELINKPALGIRPRDAFLDFMLAEGWSLVSFHSTGTANATVFGSYTMIFKSC